MQISGVVILYYPDVSVVIRNIQSYIQYVSELIVFDNSNCGPEVVDRITAISPKITFIENTQNEGIAKPLNRALQLLMHKSEWLLTMDQDSYFEKIQADAYFTFFTSNFSQLENVAVVSPNHSSEGPSDVVTGEYKEVKRAITSGSILNTKICKELDGFDERLFIDDVDFEYCYRCIIAGYKIIQLNSIYLTHVIGTRKQAGYFSVLKRSGRSIHSPQRIYYMVRNYFYVSKKYKTLLPEEIKQREKELLVILKNNLFFSRKFFEVLGAAVKGYWDFKLNRFSS